VKVPYKRKNEALVITQAANTSSFSIQANVMLINAKFLKGLTIAILPSIGCYLFHCFQSFPIVSKQE
jgi:hypothetical protein